MRPLDAVWHLLNFFAPAAGVAILASLFACLIGRRALKGVGFVRLALLAFAGCAAALVAGLVVFGQDGKLITYAAMLLAGAAVLTWAGSHSH